MKQQLTYNQLKLMAHEVSLQLKARYSDELSRNRLYLYAVARGGLTFGQLVSYYMALPLGVCYPRSYPNPVHLFHPECDDLKFEDRALFVYLEDVVAQGRTLEKVLGNHKAFYGDKIRAEFIPAVLDSKVQATIAKQVNIAGMITSDWIVFPHEQFDTVVEGDRGLFRDRTSENSKPII